MICYKDRSWCSTKCANLECTRNFTEEERAKARAWWPGEGGPPVAFTDFKTDTCGYIHPVANTMMAADV